MEGNGTMKFRKTALHSKYIAVDVQIKQPHGSHFTLNLHGHVTIESWHLMQLPRLECFQEWNSRIGLRCEEMKDRYRPQGQEQEPWNLESSWRREKDPVLAARKFNKLIHP